MQPGLQEAGKVNHGRSNFGGQVYVWWAAGTRWGRVMSLVNEGGWNRKYNIKEGEAEWDWQRNRECGIFEIGKCNVHSIRLQQTQLAFEVAQFMLVLQIQRRCNGTFALPRRAAWVEEQVLHHLWLQGMGSNEQERMSGTWSNRVQYLERGGRGGGLCMSHLIVQLYYHALHNLDNFNFFLSSDRNPPLPGFPLSARSTFFMTLVCLPFLDSPDPSSSLFTFPSDWREMQHPSLHFLCHHRPKT